MTKPSPKPPPRDALGIMVESKPTSVQKREAFVSNIRGVLAFLIVFSMLGSILLIQYHQSQNKGLLKDVHTSTNILVNCTTPKHKCYEDSIKNQVNIIGGLNNVITLAAYCSKLPNNETLSEIRACVRKGLK